MLAHGVHPYMRACARVFAGIGKYRYKSRPPECKTAMFSRVPKTEAYESDGKKRLPECRQPLQAEGPRALGMVRCYDTYIPGFTQTVSTTSTTIIVNNESTMAQNYAWNAARMM